MTRAVSAEQIGVAVIVVTLVATVMRIGLQDTVQEEADRAADCLFQTDCDISLAGEPGEPQDNPTDRSYEPGDGDGGHAQQDPEGSNAGARLDEEGGDGNEDPPGGGTPDPEGKVPVASPVSEFAMRRQAGGIARQLLTDDSIPVSLEELEQLVQDPVFARALVEELGDVAVRGPLTDVLNQAVLSAAQDPAFDRSQFIGGLPRQIEWAQGTVSQTELWREYETLLEQDDLSPAEFARLATLHVQVHSASRDSFLAEARELAAGDNDHRRALEARLEFIEETLPGRIERMQRWEDEERDILWIDPVGSEDDGIDGQGRVVEVLGGNLFTADRVAVLIPGSEYDFDNYDRLLRNDAQNLVNAIDQVNIADEEVAVVTCLCYAPPESWTLAPTPWAADRSAQSMGQMLEAIEAYARDDAFDVGFHYSFGGVAGTEAVEVADVDLDASVYVAAPGPGDGRLTVEDLPEGVGDDVYAARHPLDWIDMSPVHGRNPDHEDFGATVVSVGNGEDPPPGGLWPSDIARRVQYYHMVYWDDRDFLENAALITVGRGNEVDG